MRPAILLGFCAAFSYAAFGQQEADVAGILKKVAETHGVTKEYVLEADASGRGSSGHMRLAFKAPNRYRMEGVGLFGDDPVFAEAVILDDGSAVWFYLPKSNQYTSFPASQLTDDAPGDLADLRPEAVDYFMMSRYRGAGDYTNGAKLLREVALEISGTKVNCFVLQVALHGDPVTLGGSTRRTAEFCERIMLAQAHSSPPLRSTKRFRTASSNSHHLPERRRSSDSLDLRGRAFWRLSCPKALGCVAAASTLEETRQMIREAIEFHIEGIRINGDVVPEPTANVEQIEVWA